jgi:hypothetical protein
VRVLVLSPQAHDPALRDRLRALAGLGVDLIAGTPGGTAGTDGPMRLVPVPVRGRPGPPGGLRWHRGTLRRLLTELRPDLVHVEDVPAAPLAADVAALTGRLGIPFALASWTGPDPDAGLLDRRRARRTLAQATGVLGGSAGALAELRAAAPGAVAAAAVPLVGMIVPPPATRPEPGELAIGFVGRLVAERGLDQLLQALTQTYGPWRLEVLGSGPDQEALERLIQRHGLASRVHWLGGVRREALEALWETIDCLVVPWREAPRGVEGHPAFLLEAMARGVAPVVTAVGSLPDAVGDTGVVVRSAEELAGVLQRWVSEPGRCRPAGARARQRVLEHHATSAVAARTLAFWRQLVAGREAAAA